MSALEVTGLRKRFGGLQALSGVSLGLEPGVINGLIGPNGSGKSTFFNVVTGVIPADEGTVMLGGKALHGLPAVQRQHAGLARTFQENQLFYDMSVLDNVMVGAYRTGRAGVAGALFRPRRVRAEEARLRESAIECLAFMDLADLAQDRARDISYGHQRRLEIARALASEPSVLMLDEPAAGMNGAETLTLMAMVERIARRGITVLLVEHNMRMVMGLCRMITVLHHGEVIAQGRPADIQGDAAVVEAYLGRGARVLTVSDLHVAYGPVKVLTGVSLHAPAGRITALIGANGAGKTTTLNAISGLVRPGAGSILMEGSDLAGLPPEQVVRRGIVHVPEGRRVFRNLTVDECLRVGGYIRPDKREVAASMARMYGLFPRLAERRRQLAGTLSGGEQQMLAFARALVAQPRLLLLDEPSMGLSPKIAAELASLIVDIRDQGITVLLVEQNAMLALEIADDGYVMESGQIAQAAPARDLLSDERVRQAYLGV